MKALIACERSGRVREAFRSVGWDAISCDIVPADDDSPNHHCGDVLPLLSHTWDIMIAFPPCTHLAASGARWWTAKRASGEQEDAKAFFMALTRVTCPWAIENPVGLMSSTYRRPDQIIQPWQFGHGETKATCLWLNRLPKLIPTNVVPGREARIHKIPQSPDRSRLRSETYAGIASAMALQWGDHLLNTGRGR